ncbi:cytosine-purine permease [Kwoniella heveanensis CBS 569]|uniref:Cytosine-purine permease n=1 Tax=Kwoniella heveanensis BCC8398 TaxID=1296120 RepID=A0A1B9H4C8_9TREE|nr:cytosine-purine permease [Kwoniella heveanensis BCC8398]OCF44625.1 cytosine-purine permease [Kwoniella heveanensis CBS 569]
MSPKFSSAEDQTQQGSTLEAMELVDRSDKKDAYLPQGEGDGDGEQTALPRTGYGYDEEAVAAGRYRKYDHGVLGLAKKGMDILVEHGVEERGIDPRPEDDRDELTIWSYLPQTTLWAAFNTNILSFSEGVIGPALFGLNWKASASCIVLFTLASGIPVAYCATNGPKTGMRQMVQARYGLGYFPAMIFGLINCATMIGFMSLTAILAGQCLSLASNSTMSYDVGIVIAALIALILSFVGLRALHIVSLTAFPLMIIVYIALAGLSGSKLHLAVSEAAAAATNVTASGVLGYGASLIGFTITYSALASDFTTSLPAHTPRLQLFLCVYLGLTIPIILITLLGAACQLAAFSVVEWGEASEIGVGNLIFAIFGGGGGARFVMVLFCLSVVANTAPTIYSAGLSGQVAIPFLIRIPRYFLAVIVTAIYLPIAIVGASKFYVALENFSAVLSYWTALYIPPTLIEPMVFRRPVSRKTYPVEIWNKIGKLPMGLASLAAAACGIPIIAAGMSQSWWTGWIARRITEGSGDVAFEFGACVVTLVFLPARYLERKYTGR